MNDWEIDHLDVKTAFLHGESDKESTWKNLKVQRNQEERTGYAISIRASMASSNQLAMVEETV